MKGDPGPIGEYMKEYFLPGGQYYRPQNFHEYEPETRFDYCNHAFSLAGHLVELLSSIELDEYCQQNIFKPLGMKDTSFFLKNLEQDRIATCHQRITGNVSIPLPHYGIPD